MADPTATPTPTASPTPTPTDAARGGLPFPPATASPDLPALEEEILAGWQAARIFQRTQEQPGELAAPRGDFVFYDGPPFGNGLPHYGHLLASYIKDTVPRFWTMRGLRVARRFGWDCHGLPIEMEVQKQLDLKSSADVEAYGVARFNESCRATVLKYAAEWRRIITRIGRFVDFDDDYKTMDLSFMESVWWVFKRLWDEGLVYQGHRVVPYSWACATPLSNFEAKLNYRDVQDPSLTVMLRALDDPEGEASFLAWTTTPWTLPSNMALCVGPEIDYVLARDAKTGAKLYLAASRLSAYWKKPADYEVLRRLTGKELAGRRYEPLLPWFAHLAAEGAFRVVVDAYATDDSGTGIVHQAPAFGEDDYRVCKREGVPFVDPVDADGRFTAEVGELAGQLVKDADKAIIKRLKDEGRVFRHDTLVHSYPFCWRTDTPLIYKAISAWYVRVEAIKDKLVANNAKVRWVPDWVGDKRFGNWLTDARDWNISRNRYWGSCIPIWRCDSPDSQEVVAVGSLAELEALSGVRLEDLHKHHVDQVTWPSRDGKGTMRRVPEVFDCWFESGAMPYGQVHYPFERREWFEGNFPAHFIGEGLDQTRGWFYTLLVLSSALFDKPAFESCVVNGLILAADGRKMSKREKNYTAPEILIDRFGSDAMRFYMLSSPVVEGQNLRFVDDEVQETVKTMLLPLWNAYRFFSEYANADRWEPSGAVGDDAAAGAERRPETLRGRPRHPLDRYILAELQLTLRRVTEAMDGYVLMKASRAARDFVETLNNWYIRRSRRRFWKSEDDRDKREAFETLYHVLVTYTKVLAPFAPFLADRLYRSLTGRESVHLAAWPAVDEALVDEALSRDVAAVRKAIALGHAIRARAKVKTRQPLRLVKLAGLGQALAAESREVILEELNVKALEVLDDPRALARKLVKPDGRKLGPRLRGAVQQVIQRAKDGDFRELGEGRVEVLGHVLEPGEFEVAWEVAEGFDCEADGDTVVLLDLGIDDGLRREGYVRDLVRHLQSLRKDAGYEVGDRIEALVEASGELAQAVQEHGGYISQEVLARALHAGADGRRWDATIDIDLDGLPARLGVVRA